MQDMGNVATMDQGYTCAHPHNGSESSDGNFPDKYATKHDPFVFFHSIVDDPARCKADVVPMDDMFKDLQSVGTTPNFSYITPNMCDDGHDTCSAGYTFDGTHGGLLDGADKFSAWLLPQIFASPAYRQDGMVILTYDESDVIIGTGVPAGSSHNEDTSCCNEVPGPNSPDPGIGGPGGGQVGAVLISPFIQPGTTTASASPVAPTTVAPDAYNHYSMLRSLEDLFGITTGGADGLGHLGFAAKPAAAPGDPGSFGNDVYNLPAVTAHPSPLKGIAPRDATPGAQPVGPRAASVSSAWEAPGPQSNHLNAIRCMGVHPRIAAGDAGTVLVRSAGGSWSSVPTGT